MPFMWLWSVYEHRKLWQFFLVFYLHISSSDWFWNGSINGLNLWLIIFSASNFQNVCVLFQTDIIESFLSLNIRKSIYVCHIVNSFVHACKVLKWDIFFREFFCWKIFLEIDIDVASELLKFMDVLLFVIWCLCIMSYNMESFGLKALKNAEYFMYKNVGIKKLWNESLSIESRDDLQIVATNSHVNSMKFSCRRCCGDSSREVILCKYSSHFNRHSIYAYIRSFITYAENSSNFCLKTAMFGYDTCTFYLIAINIDQFCSSILKQQ